MNKRRYIYLCIFINFFVQAHAAAQSQDAPEINRLHSVARACTPVISLLKIEKAQTAGELSLFFLVSLIYIFGSGQQP